MHEFFLRTTLHSDSEQLRRNYGCYDITKTCKITLQNFVTKLRYEITLRNYVPKLLRKTKKNRNYVTLLQI
jgi:hypothetical protein